MSTQELIQEQPPAAAAHPRFTQLAGVAVADSKTGLIWSLAETAPMTWSQAREYCASLNLLGQADWRLPTREELLTLVDDTRHSPAIDVEFFPDCKRDWYWTSTPAAFSPGVYAWVVYFYYGSVYWDGQDGSIRVRAVRASQS